MDTAPLPAVQNAVIPGAINEILHMVVETVLAWGLPRSFSDLRLVSKQFNGLVTPVAPKNLRGVRAEIKPAWIRTEFSCRGAPSSLDDSRRAKSSGEEQIDTDEDTSGNPHRITGSLRKSILEPHCRV